MNPAKQLFYRGWRLGVVGISLALIAYLLYFHRLGSLTPGYSPAELTAYHSASSLRAIGDNPVYAPYTLVVWLLTAVLHHGILMTRVVAASLGVLAGLLFFTIARRRYDFRVAFFATVLFATSSGLLHYARLGTGLITQMGVLACISSVLWYRARGNNRMYAGYWLVVLLALFWYVPGVLWFELLGLIVLLPDVKRQLSRTPSAHLAGYTGVFLVVILPLIIASIRTPHVALLAAGLPQHLHTLSHIGSNFLNAVLSIGIRSNGDPFLWVGHAPLLNIIELVLLVVGIYYYLYEVRSARAIFWGGGTLLSIVLISLGGGVGFASLIPLLYLAVAGGIDHLLSEWLRVFPRNPIARATGIILVSTMLFFSILYQVRSYFVAWPHAPTTKHVFNRRLPD